MFMQNSITKRYKLGNPALVSAHFADAISSRIAGRKEQRIVSRKTQVGGVASKNALFHLNVRKLNNFCVFRDFVGNELFEICNRHGHRFDAEIEQA